MLGGGGGGGHLNPLQVLGGVRPPPKLMCQVEVLGGVQTPPAASAKCWGWLGTYAHHTPVHHTRPAARSRFPPLEPPGLGNLY